MADNTVRTLEMPWLQIVMRADPDFQRAKRRELAYDYGRPGRYFYEDPTVSGPYNTFFVLSETGQRISDSNGDRVVLENSPSPYGQ